MNFALARTMTERKALRAKWIEENPVHPLAGCAVGTRTVRPERGRPYEVTTWTNRKNGREIAFRYGTGPVEFVQPSDRQNTTIGPSWEEPRRSASASAPNAKPSTTVLESWIEPGYKKHGVPASPKSDDVPPAVEDLQAQVRWLMAKIAETAVPAPMAETPPLGPTTETPRRRRRRGARR